MTPATAKVRLKLMASPSLRSFRRSRPVGASAAQPGSVSRRYRSGSRVGVRHRGQSPGFVPGTFKTEAVVLRSIRYGEADRVLHLYTEDRGRLGAVAKGVRRVRSRFGGRLEPLSRVNLVLHEGRGELCTVTQADTVHAHPALKDRRDSLERGTQACEAVLRLFDSEEPNKPAYNLLCRELALLDADPAAACRAQALAFRIKLLLAAGFVPELAACA